MMASEQLDYIFEELDFDFLNDPSYDLEPTVINRDNLNLKTPVNIIKKEMIKFNNKFTVAHLNVRSLPKNIGEFGEIISKTDFDVIAVSETWLNKNVPKDRYTLNGYNIFRLDRKNTRGGGCAIFVKSNYAAKVIKTPCDKEIPEMLWLEIKVGNKNVAVGVLYKAPKIPHNVFLNLYECLAGIYAKYEHTMLLGDFNVDFLDLNSPGTKSLIDNVAEPFSLKQLINKPTRITEKSKTLIDLIFVNKPNNVLFSNCCDAPGVSDHHFIYLAYSLKKEKFKPYTITRRDFKNVDWAKFNHDLEYLPWENTLTVSDVNSKVTILENLVHSLLDKHAPYKTFKITKKDKTPWINSDIKNLMDLRDDKKNSFNETENKDFLTEYKILRNKVTAMRRQNQIKIFNDNLNNNVKNSKDFYREAKNLNIVPPKNEQTRVNFSANKLNTAFVANNNAVIDNLLIDEQIRELYNKNQPCIHKFNFQPITELEVKKIVRGLKSNSCGVDNINSFILKLLINRISPIITDIINTSFEHNTFPLKWKMALIKPIPKIPFPIKESDFRPISLLCTMSKIIEKAANKQICEYLVKHSLLDPYQSAYKPGHSCTTAHLKIIEDILEAMDDSEVALMVLLDFSKAFDTVNHRLLLEKLSILGFQKNSLDWISSYLSNRQQKVLTDNDQSDWFNIVNGVPQGSILGPLLFTILVSDIRQYMHFGAYHSYADDLQYYITMKPEEANDKIELVNADLERISLYCKRSALRINEGKCYHMFLGSRQGINKINNINRDVISINKIPIKRVDFVRNLGLTYDEILSWRKHINLCISRAMGNYVCIARFRKFLSMEAKKILCESMVLSQFNFCDIAYLNIDIYLQKKIQKIQNICLRFIFDIKKRGEHNYDDLRANIKWLTMTQRRISHGLVMLHKILNNKGPVYLRDSFTLISEITLRNTRASDLNIWIPNNQSKAIHKKAFNFYISKVWNLLPKDVKSSNSTKTFKQKIQSLFLSNSFELPPH